jgi:hypothetical protein
MHGLDRPRLPPRRLAGVLAGALLLAACAGSGGPGSAEPTLSATALAHPAGDGLVLRIWTAGGFAAPDYVFGEPPGFTLTGDGRVIEPGVVPAIYPGPALRPLLERRLTEAGVRRLIAEALATGLFDRDRTYRGAARRVMDAPTTTFTLGANGRTVKISVYALGLLGASDPVFSSDEVAAQRALLLLTRRLTDLSWLPAADWADSTSRPYDPSALRLLVRNADGEQPDASGIPSTEVAWPGPGDPATFGEPWAGSDARCGVVSGTDASAWLAVLRAANSLTRFVAVGHRYRVIARPLLPDEPRSCTVAGA